MAGKAHIDRIRTKPFTEEEKSILFNVIKAELSIIENKKTDATNSLKKHQAWERVEQKFRTYSHTHQVRNLVQGLDFTDSIESEVMETSVTSRIIFVFKALAHVVYQSIILSHLII